MKWCNTNKIFITFFTKKCNYFSWGTRWDHSFLCQSQYKGCFGSLNKVEQLSLEMSIIFLVKIWIQSARTPLLMGLRQKWMNPSCCPWKLVTFFGKEHDNWFRNSGVIIGRSWTIKSIIFLVNFSKLDFSTSSYHNSTNIGPIGMFFQKLTLLFTSFSNMSRRMQIFHQLDEKIAETFLADFHQDRLYILQTVNLSLFSKTSVEQSGHRLNSVEFWAGQR